MASCNYMEGADFCPVLVKVKNEDIKKKSDNKEFLLQVWTKYGDMIFEKPLD